MTTKYDFDHLLELANEAERFWLALRKIADYERGGCLGSDADEMIDIARDAIGWKAT